MRAGLLSDPEVITRLNKNFVCSTIVIDDAKKRAEAGDDFARRVASQWTYPLQMIFLDSKGNPISTLNSFTDFPGVHPDVAAPPQKNRVEFTNERSHIEAFLKHLAEHFP